MIDLINVPILKNRLRKIRKVARSGKASAALPNGLKTG
jgi:hypothetical protein